MPFEMNVQEARWRITAVWDGIRKRQNHLLGSKRADWEESPMTQLRRGVVGVIAAFVVVSLSFSAQAAEKKKYSGTNEMGPTISKTVVSPGDDPKHELVLHDLSTNHHEFGPGLGRDRGRWSMGRVTSGRNRNRQGVFSTASQKWRYNLRVIRRNA